MGQCVLPSFILVIRESDHADVSSHHWIPCFERSIKPRQLFFRWRCYPDSLANFVRNSCSHLPYHGETMLLSAAFASSVVASMPMDFPFRSPVRQSVEAPSKYGLMGFNIDQSPRSRYRRMVRSDIGRAQSKEVTQRKRISRSPGYSTLGIQTFKIANQKHRK